ncbi:MAG: hypothetical protein JRF72_16010, partial [Deltaproteobacteria bacterium]|nr:hypothetical protein [Deltaproteobacteria bacterium]
SIRRRRTNRINGDHHVKSGDLFSARYRIDPPHPRKGIICHRGDGSPSDTDRAGEPESKRHCDIPARAGPGTGPGCRIDNCEPDFTDADESFKIWRAWYFELVLSELLENHRDKIKDTVIWNIEEGLKLTGPQLGHSERKRTELYQRVRKFMDAYAFLILPVSQVPPSDVKQRYIEEINGEKMETYIDWMKSCYYISALGLPAISVPCGFTEDGLPVGVQIVGRHQDELGVLQLAYAFEQATGFWKQKPPVVL